MPDLRESLMMLVMVGNTATKQYLVHIVGEPAQNAIWVLGSNLNAKTLQNIVNRPPPGCEHATLVAM